MRPIVAVQQWTIKKAGGATARYAAALAAGFEYVELIGPNRTIGETFGGIADGVLVSGIKAQGIHTGVESVTLYEDDALNAFERLGIRHVVLSYSDASDRDGWDRIAAVCERLAVRLSCYGYILSYHNHKHDIEKRVAGKPAAFYVLDNTSPLVRYQMDTGWIVLAGEDLNACLQRYRDRISSLHFRNLDILSERDATADDDPHLGHARDAAVFGKSIGVNYYVVDNESMPNLSDFLARSCRFVANLLGQDVRGAA